MNAKQNMIFFIGLILIVMVFWINGYWTILKNGIFKPHGKSSPVEIPVQNGKCPPGYQRVGNMCLKINSQPPSAFM